MTFEYLTPEEAAELTPEEAEREEAALKREAAQRQAFSRYLLNIEEPRPTLSVIQGGRDA
jgi:hypothetical protein